MKGGNIMRADGKRVRNADPMYTVAAYIMKKNGYECIGATMRLFDSAPDDASDAEI